MDKYSPQLHEASQPHIEPEEVCAYFQNAKDAVSQASLGHDQ